MPEPGGGLRERLRMWHKVLAQMTGTLSLSYSKPGINKSALRDWIARIRTIADDMESVLEGRSRGLDATTDAMLKSAGATAPLLNESPNAGGNHAGPAVKRRARGGGAAGAGGPAPRKPA